MEAGLDTGKRAEINLSAIAHEVYETFKIRASAGGGQPGAGIEPDLPAVMGNEDQLRRVLYNLLENAIKYTPLRREGRGAPAARDPTRIPSACWCEILGPGLRPSTCRMSSSGSTGPKPASRVLGLPRQRAGLGDRQVDRREPRRRDGREQPAWNGTTFWADLPTV